MGVVEAVEDLTPGSAVAHDPGRAEQTERVRDRRLRHLDDGGKAFVGEFPWTAAESWCGSFRAVSNQAVEVVVGKAEVVR